MSSEGLFARDFKNVIQSLIHCISLEIFTKDWTLSAGYRPYTSLTTSHLFLPVLQYMTYNLESTHDMNIRSSDLKSGGKGISDDVRLMSVRFETKKLLEFPRDKTRFSKLETEIHLNFQTLLFEIFWLMPVLQYFNEKSKLYS